jgi:hypothetical protein
MPDEPQPLSADSSVTEGAAGLRGECARKALEALIDTAKSYRSDALGQPAAPEDRVGMMFAKYNHAPKRCDRDAVIAEADAALSTPCPCEELREQDWQHVREMHKTICSYSNAAGTGEVQQLRAELAKLQTSYEQICEQCASAERELNAAHNELAGEKERAANLEMARDIAQDRIPGLEQRTWAALKLAQTFQERALKAEADLAASQERERVLRADKDRLDWLERNGHCCDSFGSGSDDRWWNVVYNDGNQAEGATPREAIDAARALTPDRPYTAPSPERPSTADEGLSISGQETEGNHNA